MLIIWKYEIVISGGWAYILKIDSFRFFRARYVHTTNSFDGNNF